MWNHREFSIEYAPPANVLKIAGVHVDYLLDNANDAKAVESIADPRAFFEQLYLHVVFALAGVEPATGTVRRPRLLCKIPHSEARLTATRRRSTQGAAAGSGTVPACSPASAAAQTRGSACFSRSGLAQSSIANVVRRQ